MSETPDSRGLVVKVLAFSAGGLILGGLFLLTTDLPMLVGAGVTLAGLADLALAAALARRT